MGNVSVNECTFIGTLGKDIEIKYNSSGLAIANFSIACSKSVKKGEEWENKTDWIPIVVFGKIAEYVANKASKGTVLYVVGEYNTSSYEKDGQKIYKTQIAANTVKIVSGKSESSQNTQEELAVDDGNTNDLPF